jgi:DNA-binding transcriptional ArsR family regulator
VNERWAKALAHPLRVRILVELNRQPMSPARFSDLRPEATLQEVSKHFRRLEDLGCIELVERKTGRGRRRGSPENVFRAVQRCLFDLTAWQALPASDRAGVTGTAVSTYIERVVEATAAGTFDRRDDRHFTWIAMEVDEVGWHELLQGTLELFHLSTELRVQATLRGIESELDLLPVTVGLACFESPRTRSGLPRSQERIPIPQEEVVVDYRLAKAMAHPLRVRILVELNKRDMSPQEYFDQVGGASLSTISKHFRKLEELGCLQLIERRVVKGGRHRPARNLFRAMQRSLFDESSWEALPPSIKSEVTGVTFTSFVERIAEAAGAGTLDARDERHFTWTALQFDEQAWTEMTAATDHFFRRAIRIREEAVSRLARRGGQVIAVTLQLACFESPRDVSRRV